jgi:F-type H+-transporting ATPase subunit epsilon
MISVDILSPKMSRHLDVDCIFFPGVLGEFEVLRNHAPIISLLEAGKIKWRVAGKEDSMDVSGGVVMVKDNAIKVCID